MWSYIFLSCAVTLLSVSVCSQDACRPLDDLQNVARVASVRPGVFRIVCADGFAVAHSQRKAAKVKCVDDSVQGKIPRCTRKRKSKGRRKKHKDKPRIRQQ